jgi:taurine transport system substrate-binding protein
MNIIAKDAEMSVADMKDTLSGFVFLNAAATKKSMEKGGTLDGFLKGMGTPKGAVDTSFLPL